SRAARGWPWSAQARPQVLIGRSRIPHRAGCSHRRIRSMCWAESMVGGNDLPPRCDSTCDFQSLGPQPLAKNAVLGTAEEIFVLDNAFALIEGQPHLELGRKNQHKGGPARLETDSYQGTPSGVPPTTHPCRPAPIGRNCHRTLLHSALSSKPRSA